MASLRGALTVGGLRHFSREQRVMTARTWHECYIGKMGGRSGAKLALGTNTEHLQVVQGYKRGNAYCIVGARIIAVGHFFWETGEKGFESDKELKMRHVKAHIPKEKLIELFQLRKSITLGNEEVVRRTTIEEVFGH